MTPHFLVYAYHRRLFVGKIGRHQLVASHRNAKQFPTRDQANTRANNLFDLKGLDCHVLEIIATGGGCYWAHDEQSGADYILGATEAYASDSHEFGLLRMYFDCIQEPVTAPDPTEPDLDTLAEHHLDAKAY